MMNTDLSTSSSSFQKDKLDEILEAETRGVDFKGNVRFFCPKCNVRYIGKVQARRVSEFQILNFPSFKQNLNTLRLTWRSAETSTNAKSANRSSNKSGHSLHTWRRSTEFHLWTRRPRRSTLKTNPTSSCCTARKHYEFAKTLIPRQKLLSRQPRKTILALTNGLTCI